MPASPRHGPWRPSWLRPVSGLPSESRHGRGCRMPLRRGPRCQPQGWRWSQRICRRGGSRIPQGSPVHRRSAACRRSGQSGRWGFHSGGFGPVPALVRSSQHRGHAIGTHHQKDTGYGQRGRVPSVVVQRIVPQTPGFGAGRAFRPSRTAPPSDRAVGGRSAGPIAVRQRP